MLARIGQLPGSWRARHDRIPARLAKVLYEEVRELAMQDPSPVKIARQLSASHSISVSPGTIRHWVVGDRRPQGRNQGRNVLVAEPSPSLSYVIGANIGDGSTLVRRGIVKIEVADRDFAETFNDQMRTLFSRTEPNKIFVRRRPDRLPMYIVKYACRELVELIRRPMTELLELVSVFPREFLRGFFDAEGHVDVSVTNLFTLHVGAENSDKELLLKVIEMLEKLNITPRLHRKRRKGAVKTTRGKTFKMKRASYSAVIGKLRDVRTFAHEIGFSIERKNEKLRDALMLMEGCKPKLRPVEWRKLYSKVRGEWVRQNHVGWSKEYLA